MSVGSIGSGVTSGLVGGAIPGPGGTPGTWVGAGIFDTLGTKRVAPGMGAGVVKGDSGAGGATATTGSCAAPVGGGGSSGGGGNDVGVGEGLGGAAAVNCMTKVAAYAT